MSHFRVSAVHELWVEEHGNPDGTPVVCLHGGPGAGIDPRDVELFDPETHRIVAFDQRGCGKSRSRGSLQDNTTWHLVEDLEKLRVHFGIRQWLVFGGSWGSTLALAYAQKHPRAVAGLLLRGVFLLRKEELDWFYRSGASFVLPEEYERFDGARDTPEAWCRWEAVACTFAPDDELVRYLTEPAFSEVFAKIERHYFMHGAWLEGAPLLANIDSIRHIPCTIVQGRYDLICPLKSAWDLHRAWPEATFVIVEAAGHVDPALDSVIREAARRGAGGDPP